MSIYFLWSIKLLNDFPWRYVFTDWIINYEGGYIRRGLLGEISINLSKAFNKFMNFLEEQELPQSRDDEVARGVRTYRKIGPAVIIDSMLTVFNSRGQYDLDRALADVIKSNIMPALEGLERNELKCLMLKAQEVLGQNHAISITLEKMVDSPGLSVFG